MADDVTLPGTGAVVATDDVGGGRQIQIVKLDVGAGGASTPVVGALPVDGSGVTQPVSIAGTVTVNASGTAVPVTDNSGSLTVDAPVGTPAFVRLSDGAAPITTLPVSLASAPSTAVTNAGTFAVQVDGAALTALQLIDDPVAVVGTATYSEATTKAMIAGAVRRDADTTAVDTTNEIAPLLVDARGFLKVEAFSGETIPVSLASAPSTAVTNIGTFAVQVDGAALTALQLIDDPVAVLGTATYSEATTKGTVAGAVRRDADTSAVGTDNEIAPLVVDARGALKVEVFSGETLPVSLASAPSTAVTNIGTFAVQDSEKIADNAGFTDGATKVAPVGYIFDEVAGTSLTENDIAAARLDSKRAQVLTLEDATTRGQRAAISAAGRLSVDASGVAVPITDNSGSLTVDAPVATPVFVRLSDGSAAITTLPVSLASAPSTAVTNVGTFLVQDNQVTTDNGSFTDGTTKLFTAGYAFDEVAGTALTENDSAAARVDSKRAQVLVIEDTTTRGQRLTITASNAAKVDGSAVTQPISGTVTASNTAGDVAHGTGDSGNPIKVGFKAYTAFPTAEATTDRVNGIADVFGRQLTAHIDATMFISKSFNATTTQTGIDVWTPASGKRIAVTSVVIGTYGTTAARIILWFGDNADTTYTAGTDQVLVAFSAAPSATSKPGLVFTPATPVFCLTADRELHITTDAGISIDVVVHGYEF